ncbi:MAG TPA: M48 family metallopeptidase [Burkholderiales bacterium]|nr:M48 family metallopeptidase [Burkholderiales bacterium]
MSVIQAVYFDGKTSARHPVTLLASGGRIKVVGADVGLEFDARLVRRSLRIGDTPRWLYLPGGGACVTNDNAAIDRITRDKRYEKLLHRWESRPHYAAAAVLLVVAMLWLLIDRGVPAAVERIAEHMPVEAEATLGRQTLQSLDERLMQPSQLPASRQAALRDKFADLAAKAGNTSPYRLEFRHTYLGANAFALPAGIIVLTDGLVDLAKTDDEILGVLAHELGHVRGRHTLRRLLEGSATALIIAGVTGDIASTTSLAAAAPALLLQTHYSRDNEREADAFAVQAMKSAQIDPAYFARILVRLEAIGRRGPGIPSFISTHPETAERAALARAASDQGSRPLARGEHVDFTGFWKANCEQLYGIQLKPAAKPGLYSVSLCGPAGCFDSGTHRPATTVQGDPSYAVLSAEEILVRETSGRDTSYVKCDSSVMPEIADK